MNKFADPSHPVWALSRTILVLLTLFAFLYLNAENFDASEMRIFLEVAFGLLGIEIIQNRAIKKLKKTTTK